MSTHPKPAAPRHSLRIGISMRRASAQGYHEERDALARDWPRFMHAALPQALWLAIPNLGATDTVAYFQNWKLNGLILTGGDDIGSDPLRDDSEQALLAHASAKGIPTLGICRGLQLIWLAAGGTLSQADSHRACQHTLHTEGNTRTVNSYHTHTIRPEGLPIEVGEVFNIQALADDGSIEALRNKNATIMGWMWHPERNAVADTQDITLIRQHFAHPPL